MSIGDGRLQIADVSIVDRRSRLWVVDGNDDCRLYCRLLIQTTQSTIVNTNRQSALSIDNRNQKIFNRQPSIRN
jgi:hypothetical protein